MTLTVRAEQKHKRTFVEENSVFVVEWRQLPSLKRSSEFKYLSVVFNGNGLIKYNPCEPLLGSFRAWIEHR